MLIYDVVILPGESCFDSFLTIFSHVTNNRIWPGNSAFFPCVISGVNKTVVTGNRLTLFEMNLRNCVLSVPISSFREGKLSVHTTDFSSPALLKTPSRPGTGKDSKWNSGENLRTDTSKCQAKWADSARNTEIAIATRSVDVRVRRTVQVPRGHQFCRLGEHCWWQTHLTAQKSTDNNSWATTNLLRKRQDGKQSADWENRAQNDTTDQGVVTCEETPENVFPVLSLAQKS